MKNTFLILLAISLISCGNSEKLSGQHPEKSSPDAETGTDSGAQSNTSMTETRKLSEIRNQPEPGNPENPGNHPNPVRSGAQSERASTAEVYPNWFLNQSQVPCPDIAVGWAPPSVLYPDSAISRAFTNAVDRYNRLQYTRIRGGQGFRTTGRGTHWLGGDITETYRDDNLAARDDFKILDSFTASGRIVLVLIGDESCSLSAGLKTRLQGHESKYAGSLNTPVSQTHTYAIGAAPGYRYETSSWNEAEQNAIRNLARVRHSQVAGVQHSATSYEATVTEELDVELYQTEIVSRWTDPASGLFYVLVRIPGAFLFNDDRD